MLNMLNESSYVLPFDSKVKINELKVSTNKGYCNKFHLVPMKWIFSIKTDGTYKARLVGRGDLMLPWIDFNPKEIYCGNISACGIKLVLTIAASYKLRMRVPTS